VAARGLGANAVWGLQARLVADGLTVTAAHATAAATMA
jgi:hypothetical protein